MPEETQEQPEMTVEVASQNLTNLLNNDGMRFLNFREHCILRHSLDLLTKKATEVVTTKPKK